METSDLWTEDILTKAQSNIQLPATPTIIRQGNDQLENNTSVLLLWLALTQSKDPDWVGMLIQYPSYCGLCVSPETESTTGVF